MLVVHIRTITVVAFVLKAVTNISISFQPRAGGYIYDTRLARHVASEIKEGVRHRRCAHRPGYSEVKSPYLTCTKFFDLDLFFIKKR